MMRSVTVGGKEKNATLNSRVVPLKIAVVERKHTVMPFERAIVDVKDNIYRIIFKKILFPAIYSLTMLHRKLRKLSFKERDR